MSNHTARIDFQANLPALCDILYSTLTQLQSVPDLPDMWSREARDGLKAAVDALMQASHGITHASLSRTIASLLFFTVLDSIVVSLYGEHMLISVLLLIQLSRLSNNGSRVKFSTNPVYTTQNRHAVCSCHNIL